MPLFKFSQVDTAVVVATVVSENAFLDAQFEAVEIGLFAELPFVNAELESSVIGLESEVVAELAYIEALSLVAGNIVSEIPFIIARLRQQDIADVVASNIFIDAIVSVSVGGAADVYSEIPFISVDVALDNTIGGVVPFLLGFVSASVSGVASCSCIIPEIVSACVGTVSSGATASASIPFVLALSTTEIAGTTSAVIAEIPFITTVVKIVSSVDYDYGTETDAVLRYNSVRRYI